MEKKNTCEEILYSGDLQTNPSWEGAACGVVGTGSDQALGWDQNMRREGPPVILGSPLKAGMGIGKEDQASPPTTSTGPAVVHFHPFSLQPRAIHRPPLQVRADHGRVRTGLALEKPPPLGTWQEP